MINSIFSRNIGAITEEEQEKLANSRVAVIGLGGIGGILFETLLRSGIGNFSIFDADEFSPSNFNRQAGASFKTLKRKKAEYYMEWAENVNPNAKIEAHTEFLNKANIHKLDGHGIIADGLDNVYSRILATRHARKIKVPFCFNAAASHLSMSTILISESYEKLFNIKTEKMGLEEAKKFTGNLPSGQPILSPACNIIGCFGASQIVSYFLSKPFIKAPDVLFFDMLSKSKFQVKTL